MTGDSISPWRHDFDVFEDERFVYLDSAASAQKPKIVNATMFQLMNGKYANVSRGLYAASQNMTTAYEGSRAMIAQFMNANSNEIVFTRNATEGFNLLAQSWGGANLSKSDRVLITAMEHHANIVPWQLLRDKIGFTLDVCPITDEGTLDLDALETLITKDTKIISFTAASNVFGTINPVKDIIKRARAMNPDIVVCVDASQAIVHGGVDVKDWDADFVIWTGHKLYGPTGIGILYGREELLNDMPPFMGGGDMIETVDFEGSTYKTAPHRFEAGTPAFIEVIGLASAVKYIQDIGIDKIRVHENELSMLLYKELNNLDFVTMMPSPQNARLGIASFVMEGCHPQDVAMILDQMGICVRVGHHCAMPLMKVLGQEATIRASIGLYNNDSDIMHLIEGLTKAKRMLS